MSWLFGKKKHQKDSPTDSTEEEQTSEPNDGFVHVLPEQPPSIPPNVNYAPYPGGNLYPYIPPAVNFGQPDTSKDFNQGDNAHYLNGVPFKLCKSLEISKNDFELDKLRVSEILSFVERIERENYDYSFSLEESVIAEMNSASTE